MPMRRPLAEYLRDMRWRAYSDRNTFREQSGPAVSLVTGEIVKGSPPKARFPWPKRKARPKKQGGPNGATERG